MWGREQQLPASWPQTPQETHSLVTRRASSMWSPSQIGTHRAVAYTKAPDPYPSSHKHAFSCIEGARSPNYAGSPAPFQPDRAEPDAPVSPCRFSTFLPSPGSFTTSSVGGANISGPFHSDVQYFFLNFVYSASVLPSCTLKSAKSTCIQNWAPSRRQMIAIIRGFMS